MELVLAFNHHAGKEADMKPMCLFGDEPGLQP
jgi:hypothetical protein